MVSSGVSPLGPSALGAPRRVRGQQPGLPRPTWRRNARLNGWKCWIKLHTSKCGNDYPAFVFSNKKLSGRKWDEGKACKMLFIPDYANTIKASSEALPYHWHGCFSQEREERKPAAGYHKSLRCTLKQCNSPPWTLALDSNCWSNLDAQRDVQHGRNTYAEHMQHTCNTCATKHWANFG